MIRRMAGAVIVLALPLACGFAPQARAASESAGPRLVAVEWKLRQPMRVRLVSFAADGSDRHTFDVSPVEPGIFYGVSWSTNGSSFVFDGFPPGYSENAKPRIYLVSGEGSEPVAVPGTVGGATPLLSPDGSTLAFSRSRMRFHFNPKNPLGFHSYFSVSTWVRDLRSGRERRLTPWRNDLSVSPSSFSPDGTTLAFERNLPGHREFESEVLAMRLADGKVSVLAKQAEGAVYSPDGSRLALISYRDGIKAESADGPVTIGELYVMDADGSHLRRLTHTPEQQEADPSWDPSGQRLAYTQTTGAEPIGLGATNVVMELNADGSCPTRVFGSPHRKGGLGPGIYAPAWQPGPGREAGPIAC